MILIDGPMPKRCAECPCFDDTMYGRCRVKDVWLGAEDGAWFTEQRPSWCPLKEVVQCKDCVSFFANDDAMGATSNRSVMRCPCDCTNPNSFCADGRKKR